MAHVNCIKIETKQARPINKHANKLHARAVQRPTCPARRFRERHYYIARGHRDADNRTGVLRIPGYLPTSSRASRSSAARREGGLRPPSCRGVSPVARGKTGATDVIPELPVAPPSYIVVRRTREFTRRHVTRGFNVSATRERLDHLPHPPAPPPPAGQLPVSGYVGSPGHVPRAPLKTRSPSEVRGDSVKTAFAARVQFRELTLANFLRARARARGRDVPLSSPPSSSSSASPGNSP